MQPDLGIRRASELHLLPISSARLRARCSSLSRQIKLIWQPHINGQGPWQIAEGREGAKESEFQLTALAGLRFATGESE